MRAATLAALLIIVVPLTGCFDGDEGFELQAPYLLPRVGLIVTYELTADGATSDETFVVVPGGGGQGYDLIPYRVTRPGLDSPFLRLGNDLGPRPITWNEFVQFPLEDGRSYEASVGGADATVHVRSLERGSAPWTDTAALELSAQDASGDELARFEILEDPPLISAFEADTPDGTDEAWRLKAWRIDPFWNEVPEWRIGDWWDYQAFSVGIQANITLIYNANETGSGGSPLAVLNAQHVADRLAALPFHTIRRTDLASQSGVLNNLLSTQWKWPVTDGMTLRGSTNVDGQDHVYEAQVRLDRSIELVDGTVTSGWTYEAVLLDPPQDDPFATWDYVPVVKYFTHMTITNPFTGEPMLAWRLSDFGSGFHGTIELPQRVIVKALNMTSGPIELEETFEVNATAERIELRGTAVRRADADPNSTIEIVRPDGEVAFVRGPDAFAAGQVVSLVDIVRAPPGTWTVRANITEGTSFVLDVIANWGEEREVDYRS